MKAFVAFILAVLTLPLHASGESTTTAARDVGADCGGESCPSNIEDGALIRFSVSAPVLEQVMQFDLATAYALYEFSRLSRRSLGVNREMTELVVAAIPTREELSAAAQGKPLARAGVVSLPPPLEHKRFELVGEGDTASSLRLTFRLSGIAQLGVQSSAAPIEVRLEREASSADFRVVQWRPVS